MTAISALVIGLALAAVFLLFWWLVELTGGVVGQALSVSRSMQVGLVTWLESPGEASSMPHAPRDGDPGPVTLDAADEVPTERVVPGHRR
jgi:hypothetical protein